MNHWMLFLGKEEVCNAPLIAIIVPKEFATGHVEEPPANPPGEGIGLPISLLQSS